MLITITTTYQPATDLGYLLYKHPAKVQSIELSAGVAHVFYPEANQERCTVALLLEIDPIGLVRSNKFAAGEGFVLEHYVNDRPYIASSFMSNAISKAFGTAMNGTCRDKPELVNEKLPLEVVISVVSARGGETLIKRLFEHLGYAIEVENYLLDSKNPNWGQSRYFTLKLKHYIRLQDLLSHLYILIPVLDNDKHYFVDKHEVEKLLEKGKDWLAQHPEKELITKRYLKFIRHLTKQAFGILMQEEIAEIEEDTEEDLQTEEQIAMTVKKQSLHEQRLEKALEKLVQSGAKRVLDLGCGEGKLLKMLLKEKQFTQIVGMDVSHRSLEIATEKLNLNRLPEKQRQRIQLLQGSLSYQDVRLVGYEAAALVEVIEHLDMSRLQSLEHSIFGYARPKTVVLTTPNAEYNAKYETLAAGKFRHDDHRFEWTRAEFQSWANGVATKYQYQVSFEDIGEADETVGASSQMAVFVR